MNDPKDIQGDFSISRNLTVGADEVVNGSLNVGHDLIVMGTLDAQNFKGVNKGMFTTVDDLYAAYPIPMPGCYALVGDHPPYAVYVAKGKKWVHTGEYNDGFGDGNMVYLIRTNDKTAPSNSNAFSALRSLEEFLSKKKDDTTQGHITFVKGITSLALATLAELKVKGNSAFTGNLSSEEFISGFLDGKGWAIFKKIVTNALGVEETKWAGEFDELTVRGAFRVFSLIASQMLGENDNRVFTAMLEVDHYDPVTGKIYLDTRDGKLYNPFRKDDYIMVQQYNGMPSADNDYYITKHYELIITGAGVGDMTDGEKRLDWVTFSNFVSADGREPAAVIRKGDTLTRVDNATDADRKGIIQVMTVGSATPYIDIIHGLKTDPDNALKGRLGNLQGIRHPLFGWLKGFGEYLINLYAVGDFRLRRTGENLDSKVEMLNNVFSTSYQRMTYDITEEDNYLTNATFTENLECWEYVNNTGVISANGMPLMLNGSTTAATQKIAAVVEYEGRNMLRLRNSYVKQQNTYIKKPGTHKEYKQPTIETESGYVEVKDKLYVSVKFLARTNGVLTIGFQGAGTEVGSLPNPAEVAVQSSFDWQTLEWEGTWNGAGSFILQYTGEMFVALLSVTSKPLDALKKEVSTQIVQTAENIKLLGTNINNVNKTVTQLGIDLDAANERIRIYADRTDNLNKTVTQLGIDLDAANAELKLHASYFENITDNLDSLINLSVRLNAAEGNIESLTTRVSGNEASISNLTVGVNGISSAVTTVQGDLETAKRNIETVKGIAESAGDAKVYNQPNNPWNSWQSGQEHKYVGATWHNTTNGHTYRYVGYDNKNTWEDITEIQSSTSYILQTKDKISSVVASFDENGNLVNTTGIVTTQFANEMYATKTEVNEVAERVTQTESKITQNADNISLIVRDYATKTEVNGIDDRLIRAESNISQNSQNIELSVKVGDIVSSINLYEGTAQIDAKNINFNGVVTMNDSFRVELNGTTHIGGFVVSGNGLTNRNDDGSFTNDAYVIFRSDTHNCFAGIGGNILPSSSGLRGVARFENFDESGWWGFDHNYAMLVGARGSVDNTAIAISGGYVSGLALKTLTVGHDKVTSTTQPTKLPDVKISRDVNSVYASTQFYWRTSKYDSTGKERDYESKTREINLILPDMEPYDNGHIIFIKRGTDNGNYVYVYPGRSTRREFNSSTNQYQDKYGSTYIIYDDEDYAIRINPLRIDSCGDAMCLIYHRDLQITISGTTYYGAWVQHKFPRTW